MEKENMSVIDVLEFPDPTSEEFLWMPENEFEEIETYCEYIQLVTSVPTGTKIESGFFCRREMEDGELCDGTIVVSKLNQPKQIRWECRKCNDLGAIVNYEETIWDNSRLSEMEKEFFLENFFTDLSGEDIFEDEFSDLAHDDFFGPFTDFEYYIHPYDQDGEQTGGLPPNRIEEMLTCDWLNPGSPVTLNGDLPLHKLENINFFNNSRQFLLILNEDNAFPLTRSNLMKRKVVRRLIGQTQWDDDYLEEIRRHKKNLDETDVWLLHGIRVLLEMADIVEQVENELRLNTKMLHLLNEENAGQLYRQLFSTYFKDMNLGYLGSTFELPYLQYSIPFILYKLQKLAKKWVPIEELLPDILLFSVALELNFDDDFGNSLATDLLHSDLFAALERFGLLERRKTFSAASNDPFSFPDELQTTPLFTNFVEFS